MLLRKLLLTAALMAPLATVPVAASAQTTGSDHMVAATDHANSEAASNGKATGRPTDLPSGIADHWTGSALPPGLGWTRPQESSDQGSGGDSTGGSTDGSCGLPPLPTADGWLDPCTGEVTPY